MKILQKVTAIWRALPLKIVLVVTLAGLACGKLQSEASYKRVKGEWYPLSVYPMYSHFEGRDYYLFLADSEGEPVPCKDFSITAPKLKKRFKSELKGRGLKESELRERRMSAQHIGPVALEVLEQIALARKPKAALQAGEELTLYLTYVWNEEGEIRKQSYRVAGLILK